VNDDSTPPEYFDKIYAESPDPWKYASSAYERRKYLATLSVLPRAHFHNAVEVGCSIGILSSLLSERCDGVCAIDSSEVALTYARENCTSRTNIDFMRMLVPGEWPDGSFDLIVFSEVLYYLSHADIVKTVHKTLSSLEPDGVVLLVHWLGSTGVARTGDEVAATFIRTANSKLKVIQQRRTQRYRLDLLAR
jgi:2-polyprenyl-3-methyl-5-hydroxy-6-metoxy-1,4-benzoquinol methylase